MLEIIGLVLTFIGAVILALHAYSSSFELWFTGSMREKLRSPKTAFVGLVIIIIGFGLQLLVALLSFV